MISSLFIINQKGDSVLSRHYREDVSKAAATAFRRKVIAAKEAGSQAPVKFMEGSTFMYYRHNNVFFVAVARKNVNPSLVFEFLKALVAIFQGYFGEDFHEGSIRDNFTLVYELLDEVIDYGYPQTTAIEMLTMCISLGTMKAEVGATSDKEITSALTGARDWRRDGISHKKNQIWIDVLESVNLLMSTEGSILRNDVTGQIMMKSNLSGMPECKLGLNDKLLVDRGGDKSGSESKSTPADAVDIDDCTFHRCVQLGKFDTDRTITFVPPDGEFELMKYRVSDHVNLPFKLIPVFEEQGAQRFSITIKATGNFDQLLHAANVVFKIPAPPATARCKIFCSLGRAKYEPEQRSILWRVKKWLGGAESTLRVEVELMRSTKAKAWVRPPISVDFQVPQFTSSGLHVRNLKVYERSSYVTHKWVRYITRAGQYEVRV